MQSSNFDSIGIKPSLFTDKVDELSFCREKEEEEKSVPFLLVSKTEAFVQSQLPKICFVFFLSF